jgi:hypothetical protein
MIMTVLSANQGPRLMTGITFDPAATADHLVAYVAHGTFPYGDRQEESGAPKSRHGGTPHGLSTKQIPDWSSKITRLSGPNLERAEDVVVGLPRARHDHTTGQIAFGPDGAMYFAQASNTAMGAPDHKWGLRPERLLTTCIMRLDVRALASRPAGSGPLNVQTEDGGAYDPYAPGAPLTIYATGTRNCYDLLFHSNGRLYATLNGSAAGGSTPGTPAGGGSGLARRFDAAAGPYDGSPVPALENVGTQNDYLLRVEPGAYYGHPNPTRSEFVLNGGNPTNGRDPCEVAEYPVGTRPDRNWRPPTYDFNKNLSPCGLAEYAGDAFPALRGKVLVVRFSGGKDIIALTPGDDGDVNEFVTGSTGSPRSTTRSICASPRGPATSTWPSTPGRRSPCSARRTRTCRSGRSGRRSPRPARRHRAAAAAAGVARAGTAAGRADAERVSREPDGASRQQAGASSHLSHWGPCTKISWLTDIVAISSLVLFISFRLSQSRHTPEWHFLCKALTGRGRPAEGRAGEGERE